MVKLNKIYTKTGDEGTTGLVDGSRVSKSAVRIAAYGTVDETNSAIGVARLHTEAGPLDDMLGWIQNDCFDLGADLATPVPKDDMEDETEDLRIRPEQVSRLEKHIDALNEDLDPLASFVLPGGSPASAYLHLARSISRRAERLAVELAKKERVNPVAIAYLNRLSDFLFVAARWANGRGTSDVLWVPGATRGQN